MLERISITQHAFMRWRERVSAYANGTEQEMIEDIKKSVLVREGDNLPFHRERGSTYYYHTPPESWFVIEPIQKGIVRVVTVFTLDMNTNYMLSKPKRIEDEDESEIKFHIPKFDDPLEERKWIVEEKSRMEQEMSSKSLSKFTKSRYREIFNQIHERLVELKPIFLKEQMRQQINKRLEKMFVEV